MSKDSNLHKEAVADATALREISLENAKEALLERFTPKLKKIVQDKMLEASEDEEEELEMDIGGDDADAEEENGEGEDEEEMSESYELTEEDMEEITQYIMDLEEDAAFDNRHDDPDSSDRYSNKQPQHDSGDLLDLDGIGTGYDDEQLSDVVLDEIQKELGLKEDHNESNPNRSMSEIDQILSELEEDGYMSGTSGELPEGEPKDAYMDDEPMDHDDNMDEPMDYNMDEPMDDEMMDEPMDYQMGDEPMDYMEDLDEGETEFEIDLREYGVTDVDREGMGDLGDVDSTYIDVVDDLVGDGDNVGNTFDTEGPGARTSQTEPEADPLDLTLGEDTEFDVSGILSEEENEDTGARRLRRENEKLKKERDKARKAAKILREKVRSSKVLNKKLVYTNKLFNNLNLNSQQRQTVVEQFERAETERQVELTFSNLADTLSEKEGGPQPSKQLDENVNRTVSGNSSSNLDSKRVINEETDMKERMQELAGIL